jgi:catechol 2,3-dioxygenase
MTTDLPTTGPPAPDIVRAAYAELVVSDLAASLHFYRDVLGLVVTEQDDAAVYLRAFEEYLHHSLVLRQGPIPALSVFGYRVRSPRELDVAEAFHRELGCRVQRRPAGSRSAGSRSAGSRPAGSRAGLGETVAVEDPLGFPVEYFYASDHVERLTQRYDLHGAGALTRLDHFNVVTPDVPRAQAVMGRLGFRTSEDIRGADGTLYAAWMFRKPTVHDIALTGGDGPRMHHIAFNTAERGQILHICDKLGALRESDRIERGPGRHGVSNAFYLYLRDPDGHRIEIYSQDYWTGDPDNPVISWDVHDNQRRDWWGNAVVPSWYAEASPVLDLDGQPQPVSKRADAIEADVTIGADGFSYTRASEGRPEFKLGEQV